VVTKVQIPILDLARQYKQIGAEVEKTVIEILRSGHYVLGPYNQKLEETFAKYVGAKYALPVGSGTDALLLALVALGVKAGDEVITTPFTFIATAEIISYLGAKPVFVDIDPDTYCIDPKAVEKVITNKTKVIIPVHLYGQGADMPGLKAIAQKHNLKILEDACQAVGAVQNGQRIGVLGDIAAFSFFPTKNLGAMGEGGIITTNDEKAYQMMKALRAHGSHIRYEHEYVGYNARLDEIQAAIVWIKTKHIENWNKRRGEIAAKYNEAFAKLGIKTPQVSSGNTHVYHQYVIEVSNREAFIKTMTEKGISTAVHYPKPLHLQPAYQNLGYKVGAFPIAEKASKAVISLPSFPELSDEEITFIIESVTQAIRS